MTSIPSPRRHGLLRQLLWPTLFTAVSVAILISLGVWQLHRLAWKEGLLANIAARADRAADGFAVARRMAGA